MAEEKERIYVEIFPDVKIEVSLSRKEIEEYGGAESIRQYLITSGNTLYGDLTNPHLKNEIGKIVLKVAQLRLEASKIFSKDISHKVN